MTIAYTTNVNTGKKKGVAVKKKSVTNSQFII